jgi:hypothetical protein
LNFSFRTDPDSGFSTTMLSSFFRRRSATPRGPEYELPEGEVATPGELAEYHRRKRRSTCYQVLVFFGAVTAVFIGATYVPGPSIRLCYWIAVGLVWGLLTILAGESFRCPVCETPFENRGHSLRDLSPERRAALYGKYRWCESCGTKFEKFPGALYPSDTDSEEKEDDEDRGIL